jgi:hypothetical protein
MSETTAAEKPVARPRCLQCGRKPARALEAGARPVFCSLRCAARRAVEGTVDLMWCPAHRLWFNTWQEMREHQPCLGDPARGQ